LIELLVVIAIIGILSSVVLASVNIARVKGSDAAIKADLSNIRAQASIYYDSNGQNYGADGASCTTASSMFADPTIAQAIVHSGSVSSAPLVCYTDDGVAATGAAANSWAMSAPLKSTATSWCVDSIGNSASGTAILVSDVAVCQ